MDQWIGSETRIVARGATTPQEEATKALEVMQRSKLLDRVMSVEYALRDDDERDDRYRSPRRGGGYGRLEDPYGRSSSPAYGRRPSPDYGRTPSPVYEHYNGPAYDRHRSPEYGRHRSPDYGGFCRHTFKKQKKMKRSS